MPNYQKQPVKYFLAYFMPLLTAQGDSELLQQTHNFMKDKILTFNCQTLATWEKLKPYQALIDLAVTRKLGISEVIFRPHPHCVVYEILAKFEQAGRTEITLAEVVAELAPYEGNYAVDTIKEVLRALTIDFYQDSGHLRQMLAWLVPLRKEAPALERLKANHYRLFRRLPPEPPPKGKGKAKKR